MSFRLIAIDLDGTLLDREMNMPLASREAIRKATEKGVKVIIATGRMYRASLPFVKKLGLDTPLISYNGALVKGSADGKVHLHIPVPIECAKAIIDLARRNKLHLNFYHNDQLYVESLDKYGEDYAKRQNLTPEIIDDLMLLLNAEGPTKLLITCDDALVDKLAPELQEKFGNYLYIAKSWPTYLEIVNKIVSKGYALKFIAEMSNIDRDEVLAIGDHMNDLEMLEYAGVGVAVAKAQPALKEAADYIATSDNGVVETIEKFILSDKPNISEIMDKKR